MRNNFLRTCCSAAPLLLAGLWRLNHRRYPHRDSDHGHYHRLRYRFPEQGLDTISDPAAWYTKVYLSGPNPAYPKALTPSGRWKPNIGGRPHDASSKTSVSVSPGQ